MFNVRLSGDHGSTVWEMAVHLTVAGDVFDGVFLCLFYPVLFPTR